MRPKPFSSLNRLLCASLSLFALLVLFAPAARAEIKILTPKGASDLESLAAREAARYFYLRTAALPAISVLNESSSPAPDAIILARKDRPAVAAAPDEIKSAAANLKAEQYIIKTVSTPSSVNASSASANSKTLYIVGGDDTGVLYGAYRFAEKLGVRFYLHGDVIPDAKIPPTIPTLNETGKPLFETRGIQPFHDFAEGPDWWNRDDYLAYIHQLAKLRMNFIGLHCYPEGGVGPEPAVWIGLPQDVDPNGKVRFSLQSAWHNTLRNGMWGYAAMKTSDFSAGAAQLFPADAYGPDVQRDLMPLGQTPAQRNAVFNNAGAMLHDAFAEARALGVKTCIGTETPLTIPKMVQERIKALGKNPKDPKVVQEVYKGIFTRIKALYPADYYWLWTPEGWTWGGNNPEQFQATVSDLSAALAALKELGDPFTLATCGWVLGPQHDRAALDKILPKNVPMSCINRVVGHEAVEPGFQNVQGRPKWAIPWMENDPDLTAPQPWAGRMRADAATALRYGCTGLLGIHWRTKALAANVAALADAAWDQSWVPAGFKVKPPPPPQTASAPARPSRGRVAAFKAPVKGTDEPAIYQTVRYNMDGFSFKVPNGAYTVTLKFNEPHYTAAGVRVFGVRIQGQTVIPTLDIFAKTGRNQALDYTFKEIAVKNGQLKIDFIKQVEYPCIAGIVIEGGPADKPLVKKVNCGGPKFKDYDADNTAPTDPNAPAGQHSPDQDRTVPVVDFYVDLATASFGPEAGPAAGKILAAHDGTALPEPTGWQGGPGGVKINPAPWSEVKKQYAFVDELAALRPGIKSAGDLERFDYWLNTCQYMRELAHAGCLRGELDKQASALKAEKDKTRKQALAVAMLQTRLDLARAWEAMITFQIAATDTPGELGTLANLEQHSRVKLQFLSAHDKELAAALDKPLPPEAAPAASYTGPERIIVPTVRTLARPGESLTLRVLIAAPAGQGSGELFWRPLGGNNFMSAPLRHIARGVYEAAIPAAPAGALGLEYYIQARTGGRTLLWPPTAPGICQTVITGLKARD